MRSWSLSLVAEPTDEPVSVPEQQLHSRIDYDDEAEYLAGLITAARRRAEIRTGRQICTATWRLSLPDFPRVYDSDTGLVGVIRLPRPPLQSVTTVQYTDPAGVSRTVTGFQVNTSDEPGYICPAYGTSWPLVRRMPAAVNITFVCGYGDASAVPADIKHAIKFLVSHWYENREAVLTGTISSTLPMAAESLLAGASFGRYVLDVADFHHH